MDGRDYKAGVLCLVFAESCVLMNSRQLACRAIGMTGPDRVPIVRGQTLEHLHWWCPEDVFNTTIPRGANADD